MGTSHAPLRYTPMRWMQFVDGENITIRAQELLAGVGITLAESNQYRRDCFSVFGRYVRNAFGEEPFNAEHGSDSLIFLHVTGW